VKSTEIYKIIIVRNIKHDLKEPLDSRQYILKESFLRERERERERERLNYLYQRPVVDVEE
jgi:hypothetical protein